MNSRTGLRSSQFTILIKVPKKDEMASVDRIKNTVKP
jgi:hypothetical protein